VKTLACSIVAMSFVLGNSSFAATVTPIKGDVHVNTGSGFRSVSGAAEVAPGTSVMVSPNGRGEIRYSDGCKRALLPGSVAVVPPVSPCAQGQASECLSAPNPRPVNAYGEPIGGCVDYTGYLALGATGAAIGVALYEATRNNGNNNNNVVIAPVIAPVSP
jgi:hypothetical protein